MSDQPDQSDHLSELRHSCAHLLAAAVKQLYPQAQLTLGPAIESGFYYDIDFGDQKISDSDLKAIESLMKKLVNSWASFDRHEVTQQQALAEFADNPYKQELINEFALEGKQLSIYQSGDFRDLCRGGHVDNPSAELKHFKLLSVAGAYWRGDEKNKMLTRIYGTAFASQEELDAHLRMLEEAKKRDHRKLGQELDLFSTNLLTGPGLILWHPKLAVVRGLVEDIWKKKHTEAGYKLVYTPHIASSDMFTISRHYSKYADAMFPPMFHEYIQGESKPDYTRDEQIKPMNCPNHIQIYKDAPRSYRELPIRLGELGTVYRYERAGVLHGLTRVRGFTQDDSHLFCRPDQVVQEARGILRLTIELYNLFGFTDFKAYLATRPEKFLGDPKTWEFAESALKQALDEEGVNYQLDPGEGAFYGPKIDSKIKDSLGREWQLGTIQFDFNMPDKAATTLQEVDEFWKFDYFQYKFKTKANLAKYLNKLGRGFDVDYIDNKGERQRAIMLHRTILGSMERFFGVLIEHYAGAFPVWLAPVQAVVIPISDKHAQYAAKVGESLSQSSIRYEIWGVDSMQKRIRNAEKQRIPYMLVVGDQEALSDQVAVRLRGEQDLGAMPIEKFIDKVNQQVTSKSLD